MSTGLRAVWVAAAIRENRTMEKIVADIRAISLKLLELTTEGVRKRGPRHPKNKRLS
jgi:hypothetical protein